jgi:hypothetical protein
MNDIVVLLIVLGILAPVLGSWIQALDRRDERERVVVDERSARQRTGRK